ncbi:hypothetical protein PENTCL1PPCAC_19607, partial [Pristionchus entomophagus]
DSCILYCYHSIMLIRNELRSSLGRALIPHAHHGVAVSSCVSVEVDEREVLLLADPHLIDGDLSHLEAALSGSALVLDLDVWLDLGNLSFISGDEEVALLLSCEGLHEVVLFQRLFVPELDHSIGDISVLALELTTNCDVLFRANCLDQCGNCEQ